MYYERVSSYHDIMFWEDGSLLWQLPYFRQKKTSVPHDRIFSHISTCDEGSDLIVDYSLSLPELARETLRRCPNGFCLCTVDAVSEALGLLDSTRVQLHGNTEWYDTSPFARILLPISETPREKTVEQATLGNNTVRFNKYWWGVDVIHKFDSNLQSPSTWYTILLSDVCRIGPGNIVFKLCPPALASGINSSTAILTRCFMTTTLTTRGSCTGNAVLGSVEKTV